jgi:hypothetical protein
VSFKQHSASRLRTSCYLRTPLSHGARTALNVPSSGSAPGSASPRLQSWALKKEAELHHSNQAAVALPNKLARISGAVLEARAAIRRRVPSDGSLSQRDNDNHGIAKGLPYRRSARQDSTNLMAERWVRRQGKAVNKRVPPENICSDWLPVRERSIMARSPQAPPERPDIRLQPYPSAIGTAPSQPGQSGRVHIRFVRDTAAECESLLDDVEDLSVPAYYQWDEFLIQSLPFF